MVTSITPNALEEYRDLIRDTTNDLEEHMKRLEERVQCLAASEVESPVRDDPAWLAMLEEKQSTHEGLKICSQLSAQIEKLESTRSSCSSPQHTSILAVVWVPPKALSTP